MTEKHLQAAAMNIKACLHMVENRDWKELFRTNDGCMEVRGAIGQILYKSKAPFLEDLKYVPDGAFFTSDINGITLPYDCEKIGSRAFTGCLKLKRVIIQGKIREVGPAAFSYSAIESFPFSHLDETSFSPTRMPTSCFSHCQNLKEATIPFGVVSIGDNCFEYCGGLTSVWLPKSISIIKSYAFGNCSSLKSIAFGGNMNDWRKVQKHPSWIDRPIKVLCIDGIIEEIA